MLELIIVIGIISILIVTFQNIFQNTNKDFLYAETCINKIYGDMNNFTYSAMTSRGLYTGGKTIFPKQYNISIIPKTGINLRYQEDNNTTGTFLKIDISDEKMKSNYCKTSNYTTKLSGNAFDITINKISLQDQSSPIFTINNGQEIFTENTTMYLCYTGDICKEIAKFITDIKTQNIQKKKCILINSGGINCLQRDQ